MITHRQTEPKSTGARPGRWAFLLPVAVAIVAQFAVMRAATQYMANAHTWQSDKQNQKQMYSKAHSLATQAVGEDRYNGYARYHEGLNQFLLQRHAQAVETFNAAMPYLPHLPILLRLLGQSYYYIGEDRETGHEASRAAYLKAATTMKRLDRVDPVPKTTPAYIAYITAASLYRSGQYADACVDLARADTYPENGRMALQMRAVASLAMNQLNMADYCYRRLRGRFGAVALEPAELLARGLETDKIPVIVRFLEVIRMRGDADTAVLKVLALAYMRSNRVGDAITVLKQSAAMNPKDPETQLLLGDAHIVQKNVDAARGYYAAHLRLSPKSGFRKDIEAKVGKVD